MPSFSHFLILCSWILQEISTNGQDFISCVGLPHFPNLAGALKCCSCAKEAPRNNMRRASQGCSGKGKLPPTLSSNFLWDQPLCFFLFPAQIQAEEKGWETECSVVTQGPRLHVFMVKCSYGHTCLRCKWGGRHMNKQRWLPLSFVVWGRGFYVCAILLNSYEIRNKANIK